MAALPGGVARLGIRGESFGSSPPRKMKLPSLGPERRRLAGQRGQSLNDQALCVVGEGVFHGADPGAPGGGIGRGIPPPGRAVKQSDHELILDSTGADPPPGQPLTPSAAPSQLLRVSKGHQRVPSLTRPGQHDPGDGTVRYGPFVLNDWSWTCVAGRGDHHDASTEDDGGAHPFGAGEPRNVAAGVALWWYRMTAADLHAHAPPDAVTGATPRDLLREMTPVFRAGELPGLITRSPAPVVTGPKPFPSTSVG